jgi:amino acid transporter
MVRSDNHERFFSRYLWSNRKLLIAFGISFFCIINIIYNPWIRPYFHAGSLTWGDWLTAVLVALIYGSFRLFQRHTRKHTRKAILRDHHPEHIRQHLPAKA